MYEPTRPVYVISITADLVDLHPRTIRGYEAFGLITPLRRHGQRVFSEVDITLLKRINYLTQTAGLNLAGIKLLLALEAAGRLSFQEIVDLTEGREIEKRDRQPGAVK
jgi:MerR family transcriptional regulator/heat shock protein HspR